MEDASIELVDALVALERGESATAEKSIPESVGEREE
jgi:biopolymer transport protein ExbB